MNVATFARTTVATVALCGLMLVSGCQKVSGTYKGKGAAGDMTVNFKSSDKADVTILGQTAETAYKVDGKQVTLSGGQTPDMVLTLDSNGNLDGPMGMKLTKK